MRLSEQHFTQRVGWLRAAVLGANDGIVSTASLIVGVAAADASRSGVLVAGLAGLVAGAMSMAAGEYVSVSSQADTEGADLTRERKELATDSEGEHAELTAIYVGRGLDPDLAQQVATQLTANDALGAHARDELGISDTLNARPVQAALRLGGQFHRRCRAAVVARFHRPPGCVVVDGFWQLVGFPCTVRSGGRTRRRFADWQVGLPRHLLGRARHGTHRRRGSYVWNHALTPSDDSND